MGEVIKFPLLPSKKSTEESKIDSNNVENTGKVLRFERKKDLSEAKNNLVEAYLYKDSPKIFVGGEVVIKFSGKKYKGIVTKILQRDNNQNVTKIGYTIPFLSGDDPLKFGEANFIYSIDRYD